MLKNKLKFDRWNAHTCIVYICTTHYVQGIAFKLVLASISSITVIVVFSSVAVRRTLYFSLYWWVRYSNYHYTGNYKRSILPGNANAYSALPIDDDDLRILQKTHSSIRVVLFWPPIKLLNFMCYYSSWHESGDVCYSHSCNNQNNVNWI